MKLPKPIKRGDAYRISIMIDGERASATFDTEKECLQWAAKQKLKAAAGEKLRTHRKTSITVHELMTLHYANVRAGSKGEDYDVIIDSDSFDWSWSVEQSCRRFHPMSLAVDCHRV